MTASEARDPRHVPVLLTEVSELLEPEPGDVCLDATVGSGGHAEALLEATAPDGRLLGLDVDATALRRAGLRLDRFGARVRLEQASFRDLSEVLSRVAWPLCDAIVMDLGFSSDQLDDPERGLSFALEGPVDMRLDPSAPTSARHLVNELPEDELADVIYRYGEEPRSRRIARGIVAARPIETTTELATVVAVSSGYRGSRHHPATRTFQALRIAVNDELAALEEGLPQAIDALAPQGRLAVISFHSLEDRIVKWSFREAAADCVCPPELPECRCDHEPSVAVITRRPVTPSDEEARANPRSRSAKLRVVERLTPLPNHTNEEDTNE